MTDIRVHIGSVKKDRINILDIFIWNCERGMALDLEIFSSPKECAEQFILLFSCV